MSCWLTDPDLFLYAKGIGSDDVHLWRCKKPVSSSSSSSLVMQMKSDDFDYVSNVKNHLELIADLFAWDESEYKRLVKYIFERRLLVNSHGFVIAELLHKVVDQDGNKMIDDANEEVPIYIRSLDILALKPYIPNLRERPIPLGTVQVFEDVNGKAAMMEEDSNITKLTARVDHLESKNKTLEGKVTKLTADLATQMDSLATLQRQLNQVMENSNYKQELWINGLTHHEWVGIEGLMGGSTYDDLAIIGPRGGFVTRDDYSTNVRAIYWYTIKKSIPGRDYRGICLDELTPNKEKARFSINWESVISQGRTYVLRRF